MDFKSLSSADSPDFTKTQSEEDPEKRLQQFDQRLKLTLTNIDCEEDEEIELSQEWHHEEQTLPIPDSPDVNNAFMKRNHEISSSPSPSLALSF